MICTSLLMLDLLLKDIYTNEHDILKYGFKETGCGNCRDGLGP